MESFPLDPYLIAGRISHNSVIAYQFTFDLHGVSYSLHHRYLYLSKRTVRSFTFNATKFIGLAVPKNLI